MKIQKYSSIQVYKYSANNTGSGEKILDPLPLSNPISISIPS